MKAYGQIPIKITNEQQCNPRIFILQFGKCVQQFKDSFIYIQSSDKSKNCLVFQLRILCVNLFP